MWVGAVGWGRMRSVSVIAAPSPEARWARRAADALAHDLRNHHLPTAEHSHRLASLARQVALRMGLGHDETAEVEVVAVLHDVGKLAVEPEILDFPGPLGTRERAIMARHTIEGEELLARTAGLEHLAPLVRATHERYDGTGYPDGLAGNGIPLPARIVSCIDAYDAMTASRAYRRALTTGEAHERLRAGSGTQFDPAVVAVLLAILV
jgi:HD-GYP domain-containing protein (c-di-GMP phosphodiesterase class II)